MQFILVSRNGEQSETVKAKSKAREGRYFSYCMKNGEIEADRVIEQKGMITVVMVTINASLPSVYSFYVAKF